MGALEAARERVRLGMSEGAIGAIRSLRAQVPAPIRDQAYHSLLETAAASGGHASIGMLALPREATLALFDAAIRQLTAKLH